MLVYESIEELLKSKSEKDIEQSARNNPQYQSFVNFYEKIKNLGYDISLASLLTLKNKLGFTTSYVSCRNITLDIFCNWTKYVNNEDFNLNAQFRVSFEDLKILGDGAVTAEKAPDWIYKYQKTYDLVGNTEKDLINCLNNAYDDISSNIEYDDNVFREGAEEIYHNEWNDEKDDKDKYYENKI